MTLKKWVMLGMFVGSTVGGYLPMIWGESAFSMTSFLLSTVGAFVGIWAGYKLNQRY